jgi:hypothetical protein
MQGKINVAVFSISSPAVIVVGRFSGLGLREQGYFQPAFDRDLSPRGQKIEKRSISTVHNRMSANHRLLTKKRAKTALE